jgi:DNA-directed RNA polymerase specialized sigma subunit
VLELLYWGIPFPQTPVTDKHVSLDERNRLICARYAAGETLQAIAQELDTSYQRVHQIIHRWC